MMENNESKIQSKNKKQGRGLPIPLAIIIMIAVLIIGIGGGYLLSKNSDIFKNDKTSTSNTENTNNENQSNETSKKQKEETTDDYKYDENGFIILENFSETSNFFGRWEAEDNSTEIIIGYENVFMMDHYTKASEVLGTCKIKNDKIEFASENGQKWNGQLMGQKDKDTFVLKVKIDGKDVIFNCTDNNSKLIEKNDNATRNNVKDTFSVTYEKREVENITVGVASYICTEEVPTITGIDSKVAKKMEDYLKQWYADVWADVDADVSSPYDIKEMLTSVNEYSNGQKYQIGFDQSYNVIFLNDKVVTFEHIFDGSLGGVGWGNKSGVTFDLSTGEVIKMENIVTSKEGYINACKKYVMEQLKADERFEYLNEDYEDIVNDTIERMGGYLTENGIVCLEIPKYGISTGAAGEFRYTIPYSLIKDYVDSEYVF